MPRITVSLPDHVYRRAHERAKRRGCSVSALVTEVLASWGAAGDEFERLVAQQEEVLAEIESFRAADRMGRDELHDRGVR